MKRRESNGWHLLRSGANHDVYTMEAIPRHGGLKEQLAQAIIGRQGLK